jgi:oxygen-dependent protoporphyrinogen oxidase
MSPDEPDVVVVGAGLSGLTVAFRLAMAGVRVEVLDAGDEPGGVIGSRRRDGALYERGPNSGLDTTPLIDALLKDAGVLGERIDAEPAAARRYVIRGGRLVALPTSPGAFVTSPLFSWRAKLRLLREPFIRPAAPDVEETVAAFVRRRLGREFLDYAVEPFVSGIYAGDPERLSVPAAFPRLRELETRYGSLIRGQILGARERRQRERASGELSKRTAKSFSFRAGMQTLTDALARHAQRVELGVRVEAVLRDDDGRFLVCGRRRGEPVRRRARAVVLAVPAFAAAAVLGDLGARSAAVNDAVGALNEIEYPPVATVASHFRRRDVRHPLDGFGVLAPAVEQPPLLGTLFSSSMFRGRAPEGTVLLTSFVGGRRDPQAALGPPEPIAARVQQALTRYLGAGQPLWHEVTAWPRAIPQYGPGHLRRIARIEAAESEVGGLYFCANWRGGVSVGDCIKSADAMAQRVAAALALGRGVTQAAA